MGIEPTYEVLRSQQGFEDLHAHQLRKCFHNLIINESPYRIKQTYKIKSIILSFYIFEIARILAADGVPKSAV